MVKRSDFQESALRGYEREYELTGLVEKQKKQE
jgi:hypothetical protein